MFQGSVALNIISTYPLQTMFQGSVAGRVALDIISIYPLQAMF